MTITETLDLAIKMREVGTTEGAYVTTQNGKTISRATYMTNEEWAAFLAGMSPLARREYEEGSGDELCEKGGRPPKMASYGSSSRMLYNLSYDREGFHFEKKLPTTVGGVANIDGFCEDEEGYSFVEAKCHEMYSAKKASVSKAYAPLYSYINEKMGNALQIKCEESSCGRYLNVDFYVQGEKIERFDLKQMICHLLGIATGMLNGELEIKQVSFEYLVYDPQSLEIQGKHGEKIIEIFEKTADECLSIDFNTLFSVVLDFLIEKKFPNAITEEEYDIITSKFTFLLLTHEFYAYMMGKMGDD